MTGNLFDISDKITLVTGGSRGIGLMIARGFVDANARVYISSRKAEVCDEVAAELAEEGECISLSADLSTPEGVERLAAELSERESGLHILVNNAGAAWGGPLEDYPMSGFDKVLALNVRAVFHLTQKLLPLLRKAGTRDDPARVINIGSVDGIRVPALENYAYSASKAGVHMLTRHLAHALTDDNITVNAIAPGLFRSRMTNFMFQSDDAEQKLAANIPMGRIGRPEDMAGTAIYLASPAGSYLTGAVIPVDGGASTR